MAVPRISSTVTLLSSHTDSVNCITVCPYIPNLIASGGDDKVIHVWNIQDILNGSRYTVTPKNENHEEYLFPSSSSSAAPPTNDNCTTTENSSKVPVKSKDSDNRIIPIASISTEDAVTALTFCNQYYHGSLSSSLSSSSSSLSDSITSSSSPVPSSPSSGRTITGTKSSTSQRKGSSSKNKSKKKSTGIPSTMNRILGNFDSDEDSEKMEDHHRQKTSHGKQQRTLIGTIYAGVGIRILEYRLYENEENILPINENINVDDKDILSSFDGGVSSSSSTSTRRSIESPSVPSVPNNNPPNSSFQRKYTLEPGQRLQYNTDEISALVMHPTEPILASSDDDGNIVLLHTLTNTFLRILRKGGHTSICSSVAFRSFINNDGSKSSNTNTNNNSNSNNLIELVSGGYDHSLICWNGTRGIPRSTLSVASTITLMMYSPPEAIHVSNDTMNDKGKSITKGNNNSNNKSKPSTTDNAPSGIDPTSIAAAQSGKFLNPPFVHAVMFSPCNRYVVCSLGDGTISVCEWDNDGSNLVPLKPLWWKLEAHKSASTCLCFIAYSGPHPHEGTEVSSSLSSSIVTDETTVTHTYLVSAGNDGWIQGWKWSTILDAIKNRRIRKNETVVDSDSTTTDESVSPFITFPEVPLAFRFRHGRGPNYMMAVNNSNGTNTTDNKLNTFGWLLVADPRNDIFMYSYDTIFTPRTKKKPQKPSNTNESKD